MAKKTAEKIEEPIIEKPAEIPPVDTSSIPAEVATPAELISPPDGAQNPVAIDQPTVETASVTPAQLVSGDIPGIAELPPAPVVNSDGTKKRGRGRPPGAPNKPKDGPNGPSVVNVPLSASPDGTTVTEDGAQPEPAKPAVNHRQLAEITFDLTTNSLGVLLGPEWKCSDPQEREGVLKPLEIYLQSKDMVDIPPGAILCFAIAMYSAPRLRAEPTRNKLGLAWAWLKVKFSRNKNKRSVIESKSATNGKENPFATKE